MEFRVDQVGRISNVRRTPQGGLDVPANLTRTGVFTYHQPDGSARHELRPTDEVFKNDSLETLRGAPLTVGHPGIVDPQNWQQVAVGHVSDEVKQDTKFVAARVRVQQSEAVQAVESKKLVELSCGYTCDLDQTSGTYQGEHYDAIQRNIRYNHVALLPAGGGRAGSEVRVRMDGVDVLASYPSVMTPEEAMQAKDKEIERLKGELAGATQRADALDQKMKAIDVDALVRDRVALVQDAQTILGEEELGGMSDADVLRKACQKAYPKLKLDSATEDYLRGLFAAAVAQEKDGQAAVRRSRPSLNHADSLLEDKVASARKRNEERSKNAWKGNRS